jgi:2,3-bisphosphoglycerate-dependent phosphoglycerate mutase/probable phosphoglycerate mutase
MDLYIIRHAQSTNNALLDQRLRVCDPELTELGFRQAKILAEHLARGRDGGGEAPSSDPEAGAWGHTASYGIARILCSPMRRALLTAQPVGQALGLRPEVWVDIHEHGGIYLDHGDSVGKVGYPGIARAELLAQFPGYAVPDELTDAGWWDDGYEELAGCAARAANVADRLRAMGSSDERITMVTHGGFSSFLFNALLGPAQAQPTSYHHDNAGISLVRFKPDGRISVRYLNRVAHLPPEMIT